MRILITGAGGFAGRHLAAFLRAHQPDAELHGTIRDKQAPDGVETHPCDLCDASAVERLLNAVQPDQIYHLAGSANVSQSFDQAWTTLETNIRSTLNLLERISSSCRMVIVSSGDIYGSAGAVCADEQKPFQPGTPYAVSKIAQDMLALPYIRRRNLDVIRVRAFNHSGEGQARGFVLTDFASQIAQIELAMMTDAVVKCRNLMAKRDFTHVRDMVRAYALLMEHGVSGEVYNVASERAVSIGSVLDALIAHSTYAGTITRKPESEQREDVLCGDASKLRALTGWQPEIPLEALLTEVLDDWRKRVAAGELSGA